MRYQTLVKILDTLRLEAPANDKKYHPAKTAPIEQFNNARALAYIHLYLKVKFGLLTFSDRQRYITDGPRDGGIDAYFIDSDRKIIYLIQSKYRNTESNFEGKEIALDELMSMDIDLVLKGKIADSRGDTFSESIREFQKTIEKISDISLYNYKVVLLANLKRLTAPQIKKFIGNFEYEVMDFKRAYVELVFPVCTGTYYSPDQIEVRIDLGKKNSAQLTQEIATPYGDCELRIIYVPIAEIAKVVSRYKNALLKYNPRNFLSLTNNPVNKDISASALSRDKNMFALLNNGLTILCSFSSMTDRTGVAGIGQLVIKSPQIINGGQTASSLAAVFDENPADLKRFYGKEVLLKIIGTPPRAAAVKLIEFIESISDATNLQTRVVEADRRANDPKMLEIQNYFYEQHGLFLEKKRGEFVYGIKDKYLKKSAIVNRTDLIRNYSAFRGNAAKARSSSSAIFETSEFATLLHGYDPLRIYLSYACDVIHAREIKAAATLGTQSSFTINYSKFAFLAAAGAVSEHASLTNGNVDPTAKRAVDLVKSKWSDFEKAAQANPTNGKYFTGKNFNYDNYFKGDVVDNDIRTFFVPLRLR